MIPQLASLLKRTKQWEQFWEGKLKRLSWLRLLSFSGFLASFFVSYIYSLPLLWAGGLILSTGLGFGICIRRYNRIDTYLQKLKSILIFQKREILRAEKNAKALFRAIPVSDELRKTHPFCEDLSLFDKDGIFPLIDTTSSKRGEKIFLGNLLRLEPDSPAACSHRQDKVKYYSSKPWFSYSFLRNASLGWDFFLGRKWDTQVWQNAETTFFSSRPILKLIFPIWSILGAIILVLSLTIQFPFGAGVFILNSLLFIRYRRDSVKEYKKIEDRILRLDSIKKNLLLLTRIKDKPQKELGEIRKIFQEFEDLPSFFQNSPLPHFIANAFCLYDLWRMKRILKWNQSYGERVQSLVQELEVLDSLHPWIHLKFMNPDWNFPEISNQESEIKGEGLIHPLLGKSQAISNPVSRIQIGEILLITGSNMSGKTTYMRTVGISVLFALCGGPIPGKSLKLPFLKIMCSVKNQDSITEGISLFYAEARRLAEILKTVRTSEIPVLVLLDEILKGTNTKERYLASESILRQLQKTNSITLCTTHDLDLVKIEGLILKHFTETIRENEMSFDYAIRDGVVSTTNALFILQREGVLPG
jgi:ABC-type iron transport system FetAB ATPase subunit